MALLAEQYLANARDKSQAHRRRAGRARSRRWKFWSCLDSAPPPAIRWWTRRSRVGWCCLSRRNRRTKWRRPLFGFRHSSLPARRLLVLLSFGRAEGGMALLVCYLRSQRLDHAHERAIYLDQTFYELIFAHCRTKGGPFAILREMALLKYKSPTLVVPTDRVTLLDQELGHLERADLSHPQIGDFRHICAIAQAVDCALTITGGMYPELSLTARRLEVDNPMRDRKAAGECCGAAADFPKCK